MPRTARNIANQLPEPPAIVYVDIDGLHNHDSAVSETPYGSFDMYGLDEFEYRETQRALKEKNIGRANHMKHILNRR